VEFLRALLRTLARQFSHDGEQVYRVFSPQLYLFLLLAVPALVALLLVQRRRRRLGRTYRMLTRSFLLDLALGATVLGILLVTLSPKPNPSPRLDLIPLHPLWNAVVGTVDATRVITLFGANLLLFVPFGLLLPLRWQQLDRAWIVVLTSAAFSGGIEVLQYVMQWGRVTQLDDVIFNTLGGFAGWAIVRMAHLARDRLRPARASAR
jgi:glycopeptide antibiotics resistance protein